MIISSPAFGDSENIPSKYTCDGSDINPELIIQGVPRQTKSLALIVDDPDAPAGTWTHWLVWNLDPTTKQIDEGTLPAGAIRGRNNFGKLDWGGPCPSSGTHRYYFKLYALDRLLELREGDSRADLERTLDLHAIVSAQLVGKYTRS
jgi:hypothetical protein